MKGMTLIFNTGGRERVRTIMKKKIFAGPTNFRGRGLKEVIVCANRERRCKGRPDHFGKFCLLGNRAEKRGKG